LFAKAQKLDAYSKQRLLMSRRVAMELAPDYLTLTSYRADCVRQVEGHCESFCDGDGIIGFNSETSCAQVEHFACKLIEIDLPEMNNAGHRNSEGFSSSLLFHVDFSRIIKGNQVF
jgi:hypothetical protein